MCTKAEADNELLTEETKMSQKKKGKSNDGVDSTKGWNREEDPLQAVIVADSFNERFCPITKEKPRVSSSSVSDKI